MKAREAANKTDNYFLNGQIYSILGRLYYTQNFFIEAVDAYKNAAEFFKKADEPVRCANSLSYAAKNYYLLGKDSISLEYYGRAIELYEHNSRIKSVVENTYSIASVLLSLKRVDEAISLIQSVKHKYNISEEALIYYPILCGLHFEKGNLDEALFYGKGYLDSEVSKIDEKNRCGILCIMKNLSLKLNNFSDYLNYEDEYLKLKSKLMNEKDQQNIKAIEAKYSQADLKSLYLKLQKDEKRNKFIYCVILFLILSFSVCMYIFFKKEAARLMNRYKSDLKALEMVNSGMEQQLKQLGHIKSETSMKCDRILIEGMASRIFFMRELLECSYATEGHPDKFYRKFKEYIAKYRNETFEDIIFVANKMYGGVIDNLKEQYPALNQKEILYCSMICLGFSSNAISTLYMHQNISSTYNTRTKINKKLGIQKMKLETYLRNLILQK